MDVWRGLDSVQILKETTMNPNSRSLLSFTFGALLALCAVRPAHAD